MEKIVEYKVIDGSYQSPGGTDSSVEALVEKVNQAIQEGWEPLGGICYKNFENSLELYEPSLYQAMVRKYDPKDLF